MIDPKNLSPGILRAQQRPPALAWEVEIQGMTCIVFEPTKPKARWIAVRSYWDAGYGRGSGTWPNAKAKRVPELDNSSLKNEPQKAWVPEFARSMP